MFLSRTLPPLRVPRAEPGLISLEDGRVLAIGGWIIDREAGYQRKTLTVCEVLSRNRKQWGIIDPPSATAAPATPPAGTLALPDGKQLVVGGAAWKGGKPYGKRETEQAAIRLGSRKLARMTLNQGRIASVLTRLQDGRILVTGGYKTHIDFSWETVETSIREIEVIDLQARVVQLAGTLDRPRHHHSTLALPDGSVLIVGGRHDEGPEETHTELLTPE